HSLTDLGTGQKSKVGAEFATASVSSPGFEGIFGTDPTVLGGFEQANVTLIDDLKYADASQRGYLLTTFTASEATADWRYVSQLSTVDDSATSGNMVTES
ncbi:MAG: alkaline phosphatase, partial [Bacteroidota bacterium]